MNKTFQNIILLLSAVLLVSQTSYSQPVEKFLKPGDILFQNLDCGSLCEAIEAVTEGVNGKDFSHCALVVEVNDTLKVIEAIGRAVQINTIQSFFERSGDTLEIKNITLGRVKKEFNPLLTTASDHALKQVGQPYDDVFLLDNGQWYCSELLYESFKVANGGRDFFKTSPMTFKDPETGDFFPAWIDYYQELKREIPEGLPGLNPGSISRSEHLDIIPLKTNP